MSLAVGSAFCASHKSAVGRSGASHLAEACALVRVAHVAAAVVSSAPGVGHLTAASKFAAMQQTAEPWPGVARRATPGLFAAMQQTAAAPGCGEGFAAFGYKTSLASARALRASKSFQWRLVLKPVSLREVFSFCVLSHTKSGNVAR